MRSKSLVALLLYLCVSFAYFGLRVLPHPGNEYVGLGTDPQIFIWSLAWWPHALLDGLNPIVTHAIWAPVGVNLAWTTSVPGLALPLAPVTLLAGPVVAYDVAAVLLPALAAWTAFLLCRHVTGATLPALLGGYLFGFSSYMLGQELGHPNMTSVFLVPLVALAVLRHVKGVSSPRRFAAELGLLLGAQFYLSTEVLFTVTVALVFSALLARRVRLLLRPVGAAYALAALVGAPLVVYAVGGWENETINAPSAFPADLLNFVVPTQLNLLSGRLGTFALRFPTNLAERGAYLGLPVVLVIALYARTHRRTAGGRFLLMALAVAVVAALGTSLHVAGRKIMPLPWALIAKLPGFDNTLPSRFSMYASLAAAVIVASWLVSVRPRVALAVGVLAILALVPDERSSVWSEHTHRVPFFAHGIYKGCLGPHESIVILPYGPSSDALLWQAEAKFRFRMAGGYLRPAAPEQFEHLHTVLAFTDPDNIDQATPADVARFLRRYGVRRVLVDGADKWDSLLAPIEPRSESGGLIVYGPRCALASM